MPPRNLAEYLEESAARSPERPAVVDPAGWSITYGELEHRANRLAGFLRERGVEAGRSRGHYMRKSTLDAVASIFGIPEVRPSSTSRSTPTRPRSAAPTS